ncbi:MAG TPA: hypothetical protein VGS10_16220 [Terracidiphilus sp.]|nr:hypothetical protein [Terracidiphilus sp.]
MRASSYCLPVALLFGTLFLGCPPAIRSQSAISTTAEMLPDAPQPQIAQVQAPAPPAEKPADASSQTSSDPQASTLPSSPQESLHQKAAQQIRQEERQRIAGIVPEFGVSYVNNAASLSAGQKMSLAFRSAIDPFNFASAALVAGYHEVDDDYSGFGWGTAGLGKRVGAAYLDTFDGDMIGNGIFPVIFHQDPRYFRLGYGSFSHRLLYSIATSYIAKHDNTGKWEPNYSNVLGNIVAGAISNLYYPSQNAGWGQTITNGFIVTTEGTAGGVFQEFWPDISRRVLHRDPTQGLDAKLRAAYAARQQAKREARKQQDRNP